MKSRKGSALIVALIVVIIAVGIGGAFLADTLSRTRMQNMAVESDTAQLIVDAALEKIRRALWVYKNDGTYPWDQILANHAGLSTNPDDHAKDYLQLHQSGAFSTYYASYNSTGVNTMYEAPPVGDSNHFLGVTKPFGEGGFYCVVKDNDDGDGDPLVDSDNQLLVYVTATLPDGTQRQIETLVKFADPNYVPDNAIVVDGTILFNGNPSVTGAKGSAHANGDITLSGGPSFSVSANATGTVTGGGAPPPGGYNSGVPRVDLPEVDPTQYKSMADYILQSNGKIKVVATGQVITPGGGGWNGWKYTPASNEWGYSGSDTTPVGTFYAEGNVKMTGQGNSTMKTMSVIAEKSIETTGNGQYTPVLTGTLFIAGGDIKLGGTASGEFNGLIAAKEQIKTMGNFNHKGVLLAKNSADVYTLVSSGSSIEPDSQFGGNMNVQYDGGLVTVLKNPNASVTVQNVRRLK